MKLVMTFMVLAILISVLGLFAMSVYYTEQQARQIALRKIFGSGVKAAAWKLAKSFMLMTARRRRDRGSGMYLVNALLPG